MNAPVKSVERPRHFIDLADLDSATLQGLIAEARRRKTARAGLSHRARKRSPTLRAYCRAMSMP